MRHLLLLLSLPALVLAFACSSGEEEPLESDFSGSPLATALSSDGKLHFELRTSPQPPAKGLVDVELRVTDAKDGTPVDDLTIVVTPWMSHHGHGSNQVEASPKGEGRYVGQGVHCSMAGAWELRLAIDGAVTDSATCGPFDVLP